MRIYRLVFDSRDVRKSGGIGSWKGISGTQHLIMTRWFQELHPRLRNRLTSMKFFLFWSCKSFVNAYGGALAIRRWQAASADRCSMWWSDLGNDGQPSKTSWWSTKGIGYRRQQRGVIWWRENIWSSWKGARQRALGNLGNVTRERTRKIIGSRERHMKICNI